MVRPTLSLLLILVLAPLCAGCSPAFLVGPTPTPDPTATPDPCSPGEIERYLDAIRDVSRRFDDAVTLANSTPLMSLPPVVADLQAIRRDAEDLEVPACAGKAKNALAAYMDAIIDAFIAFLGQKPSEETTAAFDAASRLGEVYRDALLRVTDPIGQSHRDATATAKVARETASAVSQEAGAFARETAAAATQEAEAVARETAAAATRETATASIRETSTAIALRIPTLESVWGPSAECSGGAGTTSGISIGCNALVVETWMDGLSFRAGPGVGYNKTAPLYDGQILRVLDGPIEAFHYTWWHVGLPGGERGWCPESWIALLEQ